MNNQQLLGTQRLQNEDTYKKVNVRILDRFFGRSKLPDEPILNKLDVVYDKYQLRKIISFQQLELILRPFKTNPAYQNCNSLMKISIYSYFLALIILLIFPVIFTTFLQEVSPIFSISLIFILTYISQMVLKCYLSKKLQIAKLQLARFCQQLNLEDQQISISVLPNRPVSNGFSFRKICFCFSFSNTSTIQIKSYRIFEDEKSVKLYNRSKTFGFFNKNQKEPIFSTETFEYDQSKLEKIISFQDLQQLLRLFRQRDSFKSMLKQRKKVFLLLPFLLLTFLSLPLIAGTDVNTIVALILLIILYKWLIQKFFQIFFQYEKRHRQLRQDFKDFCRQIADQQQRIQIDVHYVQRRFEDQRQDYYIFSLQIKQHEELHMKQDVE